MSSPPPSPPIKAHVLCNAEPFGGGPGATLAAFLPHLARRLEPWGPVALHYVGSAHTLAFQRLCHDAGPPLWHELHDMDVYAHPEAGRAELVRLCRRLRPLLVVTVMDPAVAAAALAAGCRVVVVDLLLWFRPRIAASWRQAARVVATDFYGVGERIAREQLANAVTVPPLGPAAAAAAAAAAEQRQKQQPPQQPPPPPTVVVNLGGLLNPYVPADEYAAYARIVYRAARRALAQRNAARPPHQRAELVVLASAAAVARAMDPDDAAAARSVPPRHAEALMAAAELVCCTAGLGNLHAVAALARAALVLPPASNSQGLQWLLLERAGIHVDAVDWHHLAGGEPIDYAASQDHVFDDIRRRQRHVADSARAQRVLADRIFAAMTEAAPAGHGAAEASPPPPPPPLRALVAAFGQDDGDAIAAQVVDVLERAPVMTDK